MTRQNGNGLPLCLLAAVAICLTVLSAGRTQARFLPWLHGYADLTWVQNHSELLGQQNSLRQNYNLYTELPLARYMRFRLAYRFFKFDLAQEQSLNVFNEERQPSLGFTWSHPVFRLMTTARRRISRGGAIQSNLTNDDFSVSLNSRDQRYPLFRARYDWQHVHDDIAADFRDVRDRRLLLGGDWNLEKNNFHYTYSHRETENVITDLSSTIDDHLLRWLVFLEPEEGRIQIASNYSFTYSTVRDEVRTGGRVLQTVPLKAGLYAEDPNPVQGVLNEVASLIDGDRQTPTSPQIDIGGASIARNVGADLGTPRPVVAVHVYVDRASGIGPQWTAYISDDNFNWQQITTNVIAEYNLALQRYELEFGEVSARFIKVVKSGLAPVVPLLVTELEVLEEIRDTGEVARITRTHLFDLRVDRSMTEQFSIGGDTSLRKEVGEGTLGDRDLFDYTLRGNYKNSDTVRQSLRWSQSFQKFAQDREDLRDDFVGYAFIYQPLPSLRSSLSGNARRTYEGGERTQRFYGVLADANGSLFPTLDVGAEAGFNSTNNYLNQRQSDIWRLGASFNGNVTGFFRLNAAWTWQDILEKPSGSRRYRIVYTLGFDLRPTDTIFARGNVNSIRDVNESLRQDYLLGWNLTPKISAIVQVYIDRGSSAQKSERYSANLSYKLGRRGSLYFRYSRLDFHEVGGRKSWAFEEGIRFSL